MADGLNYPIIDCDTHINEPEDVWTRRLPKKLREDGPKVVDGALGKTWLFPGGGKAMITPLCNAVGVPEVDWSPISADGYAAAGLRAGAWDPKARIADMDSDHIDVHVLFPTYVMGGGDTFGRERDMQVACVRAYNDWISEFAEHDVNRLIGLAILPNGSIDDKLAELKRVRELPGIRGVLVTEWPNGSAKLPDRSVDEPVWSALEDLDLAAMIHVGFGVGNDELDLGDDDADLTGMLVKLGGNVLPIINVGRQAVNTMPVFSHLIIGGVLERHPRLRVSAVEVGAGWVPFFLEQSEDNWMRHRFWTNSNLPHRLSDYWRRQCFTTFQVDHYAIANRHRMGANTILWSSDYPHTGSDWPQSMRSIDDHFRDVPAEDRRLILYENAARLFSLDVSAPAAGR